MAATTLPGGTFTMARGLTVTRMGDGAMQLAGPHITNRIIKEALHRYPDALHIVTKVGPF